MDKYEITINSLNVRVKRWKELFNYYCSMINNNDLTDNKKAMYAAKANEAYTIYNELNAILIDILSQNNSDEES